MGRMFQQTVLFSMGVVVIQHAELFSKENIDGGLIEKVSMQIVLLKL